MAAAALCGRALKISGLMASRAAHLNVRPGQRELAFLVIEVYHDVFAIMTVYTIQAKVLDVSGHKA